jgi:hypothetical protein
MITPGRPRRVKRRVTGMQLTAAHLRYLLAIYEVSRTHLDISSRSIAEKLGVTKPSVVRILNLLMEQGMIVKEYYGKIYLTDRGIWVAKRVQQELDASGLFKRSPSGRIYCLFWKRVMTPIFDLRRPCHDQRFAPAPFHRRL